MFHLFLCQFCMIARFGEFQLFSSRQGLTFTDFRTARFQADLAAGRGRPGIQGRASEKFFQLG